MEGREQLDNSPAPRSSIGLDATLPGASVHMIGSLVGASGFQERALLCRWRVVAGHEWAAVAGKPAGATHVGSPMDDGDALSLWECPFDIHFRTLSLQGWPKLALSVFHRSQMLGIETFCAYGVCSLPTTAGEHELSCRTWRASDRETRRRDEFCAFFTGDYAQLSNESFVCERDEAFSANIQTVGAGRVFVRVAVLFRNMRVIVGRQRAPAAAGDALAPSRRSVQGNLTQLRAMQQQPGDPFRTLLSDGQSVDGGESAKGEREMPVPEKVSEEERSRRERLVEKMVSRAVSARREKTGAVGVGEPIARESDSVAEGKEKSTVTTLPSERREQSLGGERETGAHLSLPGRRGHRQRSGLGSLDEEEEGEGHPRDLGENAGGAGGVDLGKGRRRSTVGAVEGEGEGRGVREKLGTRHVSVEDEVDDVTWLLGTDASNVCEEGEDSALQAFGSETLAPSRHKDVDERRRGGRKGPRAVAERRRRTSSEIEEM